MTPEEFRAAAERIERDAAERIALLSAVRALARPSAGESGIIADAVASMARRARHQAEIDQIERDRNRALEALEADFYGISLDSLEEE